MSFTDTNLLRTVFLCLTVFVVTLKGQSVFETDFESPDYTVGSIFSHPEWSFDSIALDVSVEDLGAATGTQWLSLTGASELTCIADPGATLPDVIWVDFNLKPVFISEAELPLSFNSDLDVATGFVQSGASYEVYAVDGDGLGSGQWFATSFGDLFSGDPSGQWLRMTYRLDYASKRWDLFVDGEMVAINVGFLDPDAVRFEDFSIHGNASLPTGLDAFSVREDNPFFVDTDNDTIDDAYEIAHGLNPLVNDRDKDADFDTLTNLEEYLNGLLAGDGDSDGDGLHDGAEWSGGSDPSAAESHPLAGMPYAEGFESDVLGSIDGVNFWTVDEGFVTVQNAEASEGLQALRIDATSAAALLRKGFDGSDENEVWVDFWIKSAFTGFGSVRSVAEMEHAPIGAFYFNDQATVSYLDGDGQGGGEWKTAAVSLVEGEWQRITLHNDYTQQKWSLWLNGVRVIESMGFAYTQPYFNQLAFAQDVGHQAYVDDLSANAVEPAQLDNDGDLLTNAEERANSLNPDDASDGALADSDRDNQTNRAEIDAGTDPIDYYNGQTPLRVVFNADEPDAVYGDFLAEEIVAASDDPSNQVFRETGHSATRQSSVLIPVDVDKTYRISGRFKSTGAADSKIFYGLTPFDENGTFITSEWVMRLGSEGIVQSVSDTAITTTEVLSSWNDASANPVHRIIGIYYDGDTDKQPDVLIEDRTHGGFTDVSGNSILLYEPLPTAVADQIVADVTVVRNHRMGAGHMYTVTNGNKLVPGEWTTFSHEELTGEGMGGAYDIFRQDTAFVKLLLLANYAQSDSEVLEFDDLIFEEVVNIDGDSLPDWFEEQIVRADVNDALINPGFVDPADDFDEDGITNEEEFDLDLDPVTADLEPLPFYEGFDTYTPNSALYGQNLWITRPGNAYVRSSVAESGSHALELLKAGADPDLLIQKSFDAAGESLVTTRFSIQANPSGPTDELPLIEAGGGTATFFFGNDGQLMVFNGQSQAWEQLSHAPVNFGDWQNIAVTLDYNSRLWSLVLNDVLVASGIGFADPEVSQFKRFAVTGRGDEAHYLDSLSVLPASAADNDDLPDSWELAIVQASSTDPILSIWDVLDVDPGDGSAQIYWDADLDGNDNGSELALGRLPTYDDSDVDLYVSENGDDGYTGLSAVPDVPNVGDGPKRTVMSALSSPEDPDVVLLETGTYTESVISLNGKNRTLRLNGDVRIQ